MNEALLYLINHDASKNLYRQQVEATKLLIQSPDPKIVKDIEDCIKTNIRRELAWKIAEDKVEVYFKE